MKKLTSLSLSVGLVCGVWIWLADFTMLTLLFTGWIGFGGATTYFALGKKSMTGILQSMAANLSGVILAVLSIILPALFNAPWLAIVTSALLGAIAVLQSRIRILHYIPGVFVGSFVTFGAVGTGMNLLSWDLVNLIVSLLVGVVLGYAMERGGDLFVREEDQ